MRIAILSADVAGGHDAAARTLRDQLLARAPGAEVEVANGLDAAGAVLHRVVRDGFRVQLGTSGGSYDAMLALLSKRPVAAAARRLLGAAAAGGIGWLLDAQRPDVVVSTYPLVTAALGLLRQRGRLAAPVAAPVTDMAPHPLWLHPAVDLHLVAAPGDVARARGACPAASVRHARPLVEDAYLTLPPRAEARERTGLDGPGPWVLVDHSAWNVPPAHELVDPLLARSDARVVVSAAGFQDDSDARALRRRYASTSRVEVRDDEEEKPLLSAACDLLVTTVASTTAFAALAAGTPTVLFHALPGHGVASAEAAERDGVALWARTEEELGRIVADGARGLDVAAARARVLDAPTVAEQVLALAAA